MALIRLFLGAASDPSAGGGSVGPNQALANQPAWFIDGSNVTGLASNANDGTTAATPLLTRSEFYRRMAGVTLTRLVTVNIMSSLVAGDTQRSTIFSDQFDSFGLAFVGTPTPLLGGPFTVSAIVPRNGATSQVTLMTLNGLPAPNSWNTVVGKVVEKGVGGGRVGSIVVQDQGAKQAWLSPPVTPGNVESAFVVNDIVNIWDFPTLPGSEVVEGEFVTYTNLQARTFELRCGLALFFNCYGGCNPYSGLVNWTNCKGSDVDDGTDVGNLSGSVRVIGGLNRLVASGGNIRADTAITVMNRGLQAERGNTIITKDVEFNGTSIGDTLVYCPVSLGGGQVICGGFVYGTAVDPRIVQMDGTSQYTIFDRLPTITGGTDISFGLSGIVAKIAWLTSSQVTDQNHNNRVVGPSGPNFVDQTVKNNAALAAQGLLYESVPRMVITSSQVLVSGTVYYIAVGLKAGDVITNILFDIFSGSGAVGTTGSLCGLYDKAGNRLAQSVDQGASWNASGLKIVPTTAPFTIQTTDQYFGAIWWTGTTGPTVGRGAIFSLAEAIPGKSPPFANQVGQVGLPAVAVFNTAVLGPAALWIGLN